MPHDRRSEKVRGTDGGWERASQFLRIAGTDAGGAKTLFPRRGRLEFQGVAPGCDRAAPPGGGASGVGQRRMPEVGVPSRGGSSRVQGGGQVGAR